MQCLPVAVICVYCANTETLCLFVLTAFFPSSSYLQALHLN
jgi:hypothetical protein